MKKIFLIVLFLIIPLIAQAIDEKEFLQMKARALIAEANLYQSKLSEAQKTIQEFIKELDYKGYMATQDGTIIEKSKPVEPVKEKPKESKKP